MNIELVISKEDLREKLDIRDGEDGAPGRDGRDGLPGKDGNDGQPGQDGKDGLNGSPDTADDIRNKLELLQGDDRLDWKAIRGLEDFEKDLFEVKKRPSGGGGLQRGVAERLYVSLSGMSKSFTYNGDGSLNVVTDGMGTKTMGYTSGVLTSVTGTGVYRNKTFTYSSGALSAVTVA